MTGELMNLQTKRKFSTLIDTLKIKGKVELLGYVQKKN